MVETPHHRNVALKSSEAVAWMGSYFERYISNNALEQAFFCVVSK